MSAQRRPSFSIGALRVVRFLLAIMVVIIGYEIRDKTAGVLADVGLALMVSGILSLLRELFVLNLEVAERAHNIEKALSAVWNQRQSAFIDDIEERGKGIAQSLVDTIDQRERALLDNASKEWELLGSRIDERIRAQTIADKNGIFLVEETRINFKGFLSWLPPAERPREMFFAGRSVLHGMDDDVQALKSTCVERLLADRFMEGTRIRILFLDPRSNLIEHLAGEGVETAENLLRNIIKSIAITRNLFELLDARINVQHLRPDPHGALQIGLYNQIPYFAYHKVDARIYVGFYFNDAFGFNTGVFELPGRGPSNADLTGHFERHFEAAFGKAKVSHGILLSCVPQQNSFEFKYDLYKDLVTKLCDNEHLGTDPLTRQNVVTSLLDRYSKCH